MDSGSTQREITRGLLLLVTVLPLFFFPDLINLYRLPKETLLAFLMAVLSWLWFLDVFGKGNQKQTTLPLLSILSLYFLSGGFSLANAPNPYEGIHHLLSLAVYIGLFWVTFNYIDRRALPVIFQGITIAGAIVSLVGIIQMWGWEIPTLLQVARPSSTFGNKNMAAQYLLFVIPAALYLLLTSSRRAHLLLYGLLTALISTYFIYTGTRAAWGAAIASSLIMWFSLRAGGLTPRELLSFDRQKWWAMGGIAAFVLSMNLFPPLFIPGWNIAGSSSAYARLETMVDFEHNPSAQVRFAIWANSLAIFRDHPALGSGIGKFQFIYPLYNRRVIKDPSFGVLQKAGESHNDYIQSLAETGLLGTLAFFGFLLLLIRRFWKARGRNLDPALIAVGFGFFAILLEAFWDFPLQLPVSSSFLWLYAGLLAVLTRETPSPPGHAARRGLGLMIVGFIAICATAASILSFMHLRAEFYYSRAIHGTYAVKTVGEKLHQAEKDFHQAIHLYPYDYRYHYWLAVLEMRKERPSQALTANLRALSLNPYHINTLNNLGVIYMALGKPAKAIRAFQTALRIWPDYVNVRNNLGQLYEKIGEREKAVEEFQKSLSIDPENRLAKMRLAALLGKQQ